MAAISHAHGSGAWIEPVQAYTQEYALYVANLIQQYTLSVIKVVRYGNTIACYLFFILITFLRTDGGGTLMCAL
jgi:hypothetical protein